MGTQKDTVDYLLEQMAGAGSLSARKMFGEYAVYCEGKIIALVCDDKLFIKPTAAARAYLGSDVEEAPPYPGAKMYLHIPGDRWENADWLSELIRVTMPELPEPKPKKKK